MHTRPTARIKCDPSEFVVTEILGRPLSGEGEHVYLYIEKIQRNSADVARSLAEIFDVELAAVGYAGRKDKQAVTRQWFSVPLPEVHAQLPQLAARIGATDLRLLSAMRHQRKLRRGQLLGNLFDLTLHLEQPEPVAISDMQSLFSNQFGPQRFGRDNLAQATQWLHNRRRLKVSNRERGWHLSVLRSFLFNEIAQLRERQHGFAVLPGDVLSDDSGGLPTAPLWGRGRSATGDQAYEIESAALAPHAELCAELEFAGVSQDRRPLFARALWMTGHYENSTTLHLSFALRAGVYATTLLSNWFEIVDESNRCRP